VRVKFLKGIADASGGFDPGQIVDLPEAEGRRVCAMVYDDGSRLAMEVKPTVCPKCGHRMEEEQGPVGALEAATINSTPRRR